MTSEDIKHQLIILKCELCLLSQQISLSRSRRQRRRPPTVFCLKFGFFAFQFVVNARVQWEEGRKMRTRRGRSSENNLNCIVMVPTAAPDEPGLAGITMFVTDTSSITGVRFFLPSLIPHSLSSCLFFILLLLFFTSFPPSSSPSFLPFYLPPPSLSLSLSLCRPKR